MIWGVGSGRCGTKSLSLELEGVHEPQPWLDDLPVMWHLHRKGEGELLSRLKMRLDEGLPCVDLKQSYCIPLIKRLDPDAKFIVMFRNPILTISSLVAGGSWTEQDHHGTRKIYPKLGWGNENRIQKATYHWGCTYEIILNEFYKTPYAFTFLNTNTLTHLTNTHPHSPGFPLTREASAQIMEDTMEIYTELIDESQTKIT